MVKRASLVLPRRFTYAAAPLAVACTLSCQTASSDIADAASDGATEASAEDLAVADSSVADASNPDTSDAMAPSGFGVDGISAWRRNGRGRRSDGLRRWDG